MVNVLSGFKKCVIFPLNPGEISDRQLAPSKAVGSKGDHECQTPGSPLFTKEKEELFQKRYEEKYDIQDPEYIAWLKIHHPEVNLSPSDTSSLSSAKQDSIDSSQVLSDILVLPHAEATVSKKRRREPTRAKCLTDDSVLEEMKSKVKEKEEKEEEKRAKTLEREEKRRQKQLNLERKQQKKEQKQNAGVERKKERGESLVDLVSSLKLHVCDSEESGADTGDTVSDAVCPTCGVLFSTDGKRRWVGCDGCGDWYHINCTHLKGKRRLPEHFFRENCV